MDQVVSLPLELRMWLFFNYEDNGSRNNVAILDLFVARVSKSDLCACFPARFDVDSEYFLLCRLQDA